MNQEKQHFICHHKKKGGRLKLLKEHLEIHSPPPPLYPLHTHSPPYILKRELFLPIKHEGQHNPEVSEVVPDGPIRSFHLLPSCSKIAKTCT